MSYNTETTFINIDFMGREFRAEIEYEVTDPGSKAIIDYNYGGDPGWGPEWDIEEITLCEYRMDDDREWVGPCFKATGKLFQVLARNRYVVEAVSDHISFGY